MIELYLNYIEETVGEVNRKKWRVSNLTQLNDQLEKKIQDIPTSIERTETEYHSFWFLEWQSSYTKSVRIIFLMYKIITVLPKSGMLI